MRIVCKITQNLTLQNICAILSTDERMNEDLRALLLVLRQALLLIVDAVERYCGITPTTAEIRKAYRQQARMSQ